MFSEHWPQARMTISKVLPKVMWFNNLNNCLKMVLVCLILKPRGWDYFLETWTLLQPSICTPGWIPVHLLSAFGMCQVAEPPCRIPMPKLPGLHLTHAGRPAGAEIQCSRGAGQATKRHQRAKLCRNHILLQLSCGVGPFTGAVPHG